MGRTAKEPVITKTRPWIEAIKQSARDNTARHNARRKKNWENRFDGCTECVKTETGTTICDSHLAVFRDTGPCESCSMPAEFNNEHEHLLCTACDLHPVHDFEDRIMAEELLDSLREGQKILREELRKYEQALMKIANAIRDAWKDTETFGPATVTERIKGIE